MVGLLLSYNGTAKTSRLMTEGMIIYRHEFAGSDGILVNLVDLDELKAFSNSLRLLLATLNLNFSGDLVS